jgi:hypothetical protein
MGMQARVRRNGRQGILPFVMEQARRDDITARAGLPPVVETMRNEDISENRKTEHRKR